MTLGPGARKLLLTVHIAVSVAWIGAVAAYLALDLVATTGDDPATLRAAYVSMALIARRVIVPLAAAALLTGIVVALGGRWGLFRHYWVIVSLVATIAATAVLLIELATIDRLAEIASDPATSADDLRSLGGTLVHSVGGSAVLVGVLALNIYKPRGLTRYGWRREHAQRRTTARSR